MLGSVKTGRWAETGRESWIPWGSDGRWLLDQYHHYRPPYLSRCSAAAVMRMPGCPRSFLAPFGGSLLCWGRRRAPSIHPASQPSGGQPRPPGQGRWTEPRSHAPDSSSALPISSIFNLSPFSLTTSTNSSTAASPYRIARIRPCPSAPEKKLRQHVTVALLPARIPPRTAAFHDLP